MLAIPLTLILQANPANLVRNSRLTLFFFVISERTEFQINNNATLYTKFNFYFNGINTHKQKKNISFFGILIFLHKKVKLDQFKNKNNFFTFSIGNRKFPETIRIFFSLALLYAATIGM